MSEKELLYTIALGMVPGIGDINAKKLIENFGSAEAVISESYRNLISIAGIGSKIAGHIKSKDHLLAAEKEILFINKHKIRALHYTEPDYPLRLRECADSPVLIYYKGNTDLNTEKIISIVGTRNVSRRGKDICRNLINELAGEFPDIIIVSGLAYGVDITAHKSALDENLNTLAVLAHGLKTIYPSAHTATAKRIVTNGGLITDFPSTEPPDRNNFLKRNRIIAGISDATIIIESGIRGGAMVTADIAASYSREVLAVPGYPGEKLSQGCNLLIKSNKASLIESVKDIEYQLHWSRTDSVNSHQKTIFPALSPLEKEIMDLISEYDKLPAEYISQALGKPIHHLSSALLKLEFAGLIANIPGNIYRKIH